MEHTITGTRQREEAQNEFKATVNAPTYYSAVRQFHREVSDASGMFNVDL